MNAYGAGSGLALISGNMNGVGRAVIALLMSSVELGLLLLAILTLFIPRRCSAVLERVATWLNTSLRRLAQRIVTRRWACLGAGRHLEVGLVVEACNWLRAQKKDGKSESLVTVSCHSCRSILVRLEELETRTP